jgi:phosphoenolpyruvate-protein phosphotransferase (PTS system enzyme I)
MKDNNKKEIRLKGTTISPGIGFGTAQILDLEIAVVKISITPDMVKKEQQRYYKAVKVVLDHLGEHVKEAHAGSWLDASQILKVHKAMLEDKGFHRSVRKRIFSELKNVEWSVLDEAELIISRLEATRNPYFQARSEDIRDLARNILEALTLSKDVYKKTLHGSEEPNVIITGNLYPSTVMQAQHYRANGFATESSLLSSHAAILLKGIEIPSIGAVKGLRKIAKAGDQVIINALRGIVILRPTPSTLRRYKVIKKRLEVPLSVPPPPPIKAHTIDGTFIHLMANINNSRHAEMMLRSKLEGIGLFRTEFLALDTATIPDEEEQVSNYREVINTAGGRKVIIRTFDIGADKQNPAIYRSKGQNPALGVRGIRRHLLCCPEELRTQLRAILQAASDSSVGILLPMITTRDEIKQVKEYLQSVKKELRTEGKSFSNDFTLGAMIEVPAAAIAVADILEEVDFISVGTNDLLQYFMAADRDNEDVFQYRDYGNAAFLRLLRFIIEEATKMGREKDVSFCGEMASHPSFLPILLRVGFRSFSISPISAHAVRKIVAKTDLSNPVEAVF